MMNALLIVIGLGVGLSAMTILINKLMINEKLVDATREKIKELQKEIKGLDVKSKEFKEKQEKIFDMNFVIMKQQFKPMFVTFLPYIIVFYLVGGMFAYAPIDVGSQIKLDASGDNFTIVSGCLGLNETIHGSKSFDLTVNSNDCKIFVNGNELNTNLIGDKELIKVNNYGAKIQITPPKQVFMTLPFNLPVFGNKIGWLGTFIIFSFLTSIILNKALKKVYLRKWD